MLIIKVEQYNFSNKTVRTLGIMSLLRKNNEDDPDHPDFEVRIARGDEFSNTQASIDELFGDPEKTERIERFPRSAVSVWRLLREVLNKTHPGDLP